MARNTRIQTRAKQKEAQKKKEAKIQEASDAITNGRFTKITDAATYFKVSYPTLRRRHLQLTLSPSEAHINQRLLTAVEEKVVCEWAKYMGMTGHPISKDSLRVKIGDISSILQEKRRKTGIQHLPAKNWVYSFIERNPELKLKRPSGLDPKRAQNFNPSVVKHHFELLRDFLNAHNIPWENIYNMDEKGIQLGGGRKLDSTKFLYNRGQRNYVKSQSADLELVTTIECVGADGSLLKPGFVFCGKQVLHDEYFRVDGVL